MRTKPHHSEIVENSVNFVKIRFSWRDISRFSKSHLEILWKVLCTHIVYRMMYCSSNVDWVAQILDVHVILGRIQIMPKNERRFGTTPFRDNFWNPIFLNSWLFATYFFHFLCYFKDFCVSPLCFYDSRKKYNHLRIMVPYAWKVYFIVLPKYCFKYYMEFKLENDSEGSWHLNILAFLHFHNLFRF